jgi:type IV pilus assembly protein PilA
MSRFFKKQGFTLIELMVVIVIIGVLASLAIPRFSEASSKAKASEAPRVLATFESGFLAYIAENGTNPSANSDLLSPLPASTKWFAYNFSGGGTSANASALTKMGKASAGELLVTTYQTASDCFTHVASANITKMVPNFTNNGCN